MDIVLRPWTDDDVAELTRLGQAVDRTNLGNSLPDPFTRESAEWWIHRAQKNDRKHGLYRAVIADGRLTGSIVVERLLGVRKYDSQMGYLMFPEFSNRGIMTRAVGMMTNASFTFFDIARITVPVFAGNTASQHVLVNNSYILEGTMKDALYKYGEFHDLLFYAKYRDSK